VDSSGRRSWRPRVTTESSRLGDRRPESASSTDQGRIRHRTPAT
jgi:hypothetical protein